jgi:hypothetical protein
MLSGGEPYRGKVCLSIHGKITKPRKIIHENQACIAPYLGLLFSPKGRDSMFLQNIRLSPEWRILQPRRPCSS